MKQLTCILIALAIVGIYGEEPEKLVNGTPTNIEEYPHCVSIRIDNNHFCGGSIISPRHILTAAHCVVPLDSKKSLRESLTVVSGTTRLSSGGNVHKVSRMWYHNRYNTRAQGRPAGFDIGVLELAEPIEFNTKQKPIKLPKTDLEKNDDVTTVAWGSTGFKENVHDDLQKLEAQVMLAKDCQIYHTFMRIHLQEFCTFIKVGTGACNGDSGSGVIRNSDNTLVGLISGGMPCARGYPDVFTIIYPYISWIEEIMSE